MNALDERQRRAFARNARSQATATATGHAQNVYLRERYGLDRSDFSGLGAGLAARVIDVLMRRGPDAALELIDSRAAEARHRGASAEGLDEQRRQLARRLGRGEQLVAVPPALAPLHRSSLTGGVGVTAVDQRGWVYHMVLSGDVVTVTTSWGETRQAPAGADATRTARELAAELDREPHPEPGGRLNGRPVLNLPVGDAL